MQIYKFSTEKFSGVKAELFYEDEFSKEIRISMQKDSSMKEHCAPNPIKVQILKGEIEFSAENDAVILGEFDMICLQPNIKHSLKANKDSIIRLSLSLDDDFARVKSVLK